MSALDREPEETELRVGAIVEARYRILSHIASGGMGAVYEGEHLFLRRRVAIKLLHPQLAGNEQMVRRFRSEALAAAKLSADYTPAVTDFGLAPDGVPFFVMELLHGETLRALLSREGVLEPAVAADILKKTCHCVAHAHARGVLHRDLKPRNIFLERPNDGAVRTKLLDFGIAKSTSIEHTGVHTHAGQVLGTPPYMSPEQAAGRTELDTRTDVFGLGLVLYEALAGRLPYSGKDPMQLRCQIVRDAPMSLDVAKPGLPPGLSDVVHRALASEPAQRFPSAMKLAEALEPFSLRTGCSAVGPTRNPANEEDTALESITVVGKDERTEKWSHRPPTHDRTAPEESQLRGSETPRAMTGLDLKQSTLRPLSGNAMPSQRRRTLTALLTGVAALLVGVGLGVFLRPQPPGSQPLHNGNSGMEPASTRESLLATGASANLSSMPDLTGSNGALSRIQSSQGFGTAGATRQSDSLTSLPTDSSAPAVATQRRPPASARTQDAGAPSPRRRERTSSPTALSAEPSPTIPLDSESPYTDKQPLSDAHSKSFVWPR